MKKGLSLGLLLSLVASNLWAYTIGGMVSFDNNWSGFYAGTNLGGAWSGFHGHITATSQSISGTSLSYNGNQQSFIWGGQVGYIWPINNFVVGTELNLDGLNLSNSHALSAGEAVGMLKAGDSFSNAMNWQGEWVARVGMIGMDKQNWLFYGLGGLAFTQVKVGANVGATAINGDVFPASSGFTSSVLVGAALGGGVEYAWSQFTLIGVEYRYSAYGRHSYYTGANAVGLVNGTVIYAPLVASSILNTSQLVFRISYLFNQ